MATADRSATGTPAHAIVAPPAGGVLRSLRHRDFRRFWIGFGLATAGFQVQRVGLGYLAYRLTGSALFLALVFSGDSIPMILLSPAGGVLSDRIDRKAVLMVSRVCVAVLACTVAVLVAGGWIATWHLLLFALLTGLCYALDVPARQAMVHDLVPPEDFVNAVALTSAMRQATRIGGPAVGGLILYAVGVQGAFAVMAVAQLLNVLMVGLVRLPAHERPPTGSAAANFAEGLLHVAGDGVIVTLLVISTIPALTAMAYQSLTPVFAEDVLHQSGPAIGVMLSAAGVGALAGSVLIARYPARLVGLTASALTALGFGLAVATFALAGSYPLALALLVLVGGAGALYSISASSAVQQRTPRHMQGRVMGIYQTTWELQVIGAMGVGALADAIGPPRALALAGLASAGVMAALLTIRRIQSPRTADIHAGTVIRSTSRE